jgi:hypothetical protein
MPAIIILTVLRAAAVAAREALRQLDPASIDPREADDLVYMCSQLLHPPNALLAAWHRIRDGLAEARMRGEEPRAACDGILATADAQAELLSTAAGLARRVSSARTADELEGLRGQVLALRAEVSEYRGRA